MLQNKLRIPHIIVFLFKVYLAWGEGSIEQASRETRSSPALHLRWAGPEILNRLEQIANNLKVPGLTEMTEQRQKTW